MNIDELCINTIRMLSIDMVERARSGHPGMPMGDAPVAYVLWSKFLRHNPINPSWINRDRFVLSAGHGSALLYSLLYLSGYSISLDDLKQFRQWGSKTPGHPEYNLSIGVEMTTGPLGQGFATGVGMAMAKKYLAEYFNRDGFPILDYRIFAILSDGDMMEGISSEAASIAGHLRLGNIVYVYSDNRITIEGATELTFSEDVAGRFLAYGWDVKRVDGYDLRALEEAIASAIGQKDKPSLIIARTHLGYGSPNKQDSAAAHGAPLGEDEVAAVKERFNWPTEPFFVPEDALKHMRSAIDKGQKAEKEWREMFSRYRDAYPELAEELEQWAKGDFNVDWDTLFSDFGRMGTVATRKASGEVLNRIVPSLPMMIGGSADLAPSNNTYLKGMGDFGKDKCGRNIHFGVREHAMGAILNGMALSNMLLPYGATFLVFSDYMRPSIRLAALMGVHVIYIFTHDSIGIGEDGPTHQPIEHLFALRSIPNLWVIRPADALEVVEAWKIALARRDGPVALILTRQKLPLIDRNRYAPAGGVHKGGYVLADSGGKPDVIIIATGSEVQISLQAYEKLVSESVNVRVVNMPCVELFEEQDEDYKRSVLPDDVRRRIVVEAGVPDGWYKYAGIDGKVVGIKRFGASAPGSILFEKFGFTAQNLYKEVVKLLKR
ncbi:MAG: transketolase [Synergistetes bacterium]|nr:transketolase [Synergistota bacterium]